MREILFRGKRIDNGEWVEGYYIGEQKMVEKKAHWILDKNDIFGRFHYRSIDPNTLGQYTGLTDKNGKKIFEGDILKYSYHPPVIVVWHSGGWYFTDEDDLSRPHSDDFIDNWGIYDKEQLEIIGNIHDNPELLEDKP